MKKKLSIILSFVLVACMLTAVFAFTASAEVVKPDNEVVTPLFSYDFESNQPAVGSASLAKSATDVANRNFVIVEQTAATEEEDVIDPSSEEVTGGDEGASGEVGDSTEPVIPEVINKYGKLYATDAAAQGFASSVRYDMTLAENVQFANTNYITFDIDIASENGYFDSGSTSIYFNTRKADGSAATNYIKISISRFLNQWYVNTSSGSYVVADDNEWFHLTIIIDVESDKQEGYGDSVGYIFINGVDTGLTNKVFGDASAYLNGVRINSDANVSLASQDRSICFDNIVLNKVTDSQEGDAGSLAWIMHNDKPLTDWYSNVYNDEYAMPEDLPLYDDMPKATWYYKVGNGGIVEGSETGDALYNAVKSKLTSTTETVEITLLSDITYAPARSSATQTGDMFSFYRTEAANAQQGGKKIINLNGHTIEFLPTFTQGGVTKPARGQFFNANMIAGSVPLELIINGADAEGNMGTLRKYSSANDFLKESTTNKVKHSYVINDCIIDASGTTFFTSAMGSDLLMSNCELTLQAAKKGVDNFDSADTRPIISVSGKLVIDGCTFNYLSGNYNGGTAITTSNASGVIEIKDSVFNNSLFGAVVAKGSGTVSISKTEFNAGYGTNISGAVVLGGGVESNQAIPSGAVLTEGCYTTFVTESIPSEEEGGEPTEVTIYKVVKATLPEMYANLTLYSDFSYNLYIPTDAGITTIEGVDVGTLVVERVLGKDCYVYTKTGINTIEAAEDIVFTVVGSVLDDENATAYTAKKTVSILAYAETVLTSEDTEVATAQGLIVDMLKYIDEAYKFFAEENADVAALLEGRVPTEYAPTETEVCDPSVLADYIKGAYITLEGDCPRYVLVAATACKVTVTYTTIDGTEVTVERELAAEDDTAPVELRAYDMYKTLTITVDGETPVSATYNLYTYIYTIENDTDVENDASLALLKALYTFSKSSEAYKLGK